MNKIQSDYLNQQTNRVPNRYYVYKHISLLDRSVYYIGKGCGRRAWSTDSRNRYWLYKYRKHGLVVEILKDDLDEKSALSLEVETIENYERLGHKLCNLSGGGESPTVSDETRLKISLIHKGVKKSPEHNAAVSRAKTGVKRPDLTGLNNRLADLTEYVFLNIDTLEVFKGTRWALCNHAGLNSLALNPLFAKKKHAKTAHRWGLLIMDEQIETAVKRLTYILTKERLEKMNKVVYSKEEKELNDRTN